MFDELLYRLPDSAFLILWVGSVGLVIGSYLNVAIYRIPAGLSTVRPGSRCPRCLSSIRAVDNIPVLSYLALLGRCRRCRGGISPRYPTIEMVTAGLFVSSFQLYSDDLFSAAVCAALCAVWVVLAMIDWDHRLVPLNLAVPMLVAVAALQPWLGWTEPRDAWLGALACGTALALVSELWRRGSGEVGFAQGDVWAIALVAAAWGWQGAVAIFAVASALGLVLAALGRLVGHRLDASLPFVTLLAVAGLGLQVLWPAWGPS